jgi:hypothetical protein
MRKFTDPLLEQIIMMPLLITQAASKIISENEAIKAELTKHKAMAELQNKHYKHLCTQRKDTL